MLIEHKAKTEPVNPFVSGVLCSSLTDEKVNVKNPANGKKLIEIPAGCDADVDKAVASARRAFEDGRWSSATPSVRKSAMHRFAGLIYQYARCLDALDAEEMGKPISVSFANAASAADLVRFYAEALDKLTGDIYTSDQDSFVVQRRVPRGVVAAVVPWNFPTYNALLKVAPALAAGNSIVLKPSELSSRSALLLAHLAIEAGIPIDVLNVVPGIGQTVGRALGLHMGVDMIAFTGSTQVGKTMLQYAGMSNMKVVLAECGGKCPHIVFGDGSDLNAIGAEIARHILVNQGQICSVGSRVLVQRSIEKILVDRISEHLSHFVMGDPLQNETTFGPIASDNQLRRVMHYIDSAPEQGARLRLGGRRALLDTGGYYVEPTVFSDVSPTASIAQEEIFGPVLSVISFDDEEEAVGIANSTAYGLASYVWTNNLSTGMRVAKRLRSTVQVNAAVPRSEGPGFAGSWEPAGQSGVGVEGGVAGMASYLRRQLVWFSHE